MNYDNAALKLHKKLKGKLETKSKVPLKNKTDFSVAYTPGVAAPCRLIAQDKSQAYNYTIKANTVAVISDGSAVLGLGNIGAEAAIPVMEGKACIFKELAGIDAFPITLASQDTQTTIQTIRNIAPVFGGINLEDFKAPECFAIEAALQDLGIPVMHDDQHGTAVVTLAGLTNALKVVQKKKEDVRIVMNGVGAAGVAITKLLIYAGYDPKHVILCDTQGIIYQGRKEGMNPVKEELAQITNSNKLKGTLTDALKNADVFIGVSKGNLLTKEMIGTMNKKAIVMAMANPVPEITPDEAKKGGAVVIATGRSDFPNQVNNSLAFPGIFKGALNVRATRITTEMKVAAAYALASLIKKPSAKEILPYATDKRIVPAVSKAVAKAWKA
jgi:malate dehydrogenase (oxaloacetate-decarboxylating)